MTAEQPLCHPSTSPRASPHCIWAGIVHNQIIDHYILPEHLAGIVYEAFLEEVLPDLSDDVPLAIRRRLWLQPDGTPAHNHENVRHFLVLQFPNRNNGVVSWPS